eukprot:GHVP01066135.1.p2 GENE.GHVP01066135.1~~GHVP01066135.1.p2  ORF type:complete len:107 (+),score=13.79 GHVP01066135.1:322-642(+)
MPNSKNVKFDINYFIFDFILIRSSNVSDTLLPSSQDTYAPVQGEVIYFRPMDAYISNVMQFQANASTPVALDWHVDYLGYKVPSAKGSEIQQIKVSTIQGRMIEKS